MLLNQSTQVYAQIPNLFRALANGQAPNKFNREFLRDLGFKSTNHHAFIPLLKGLGFISAEGVPTERYRSLLDKTKWRKAIAEAIKEAYGDIFVIKAQPTKNDFDAIVGKFKSTYNLTDLTADRSARTFLALLELAVIYFDNAKNHGEVMCINRSFRTCRASRMRCLFH
jgi:hypothetical protein